MTRTPPRTTRLAVVTLSTVALLAGILGASPAVAAGTTNPVLPATARQLVSGWMPYWTPDTSLASFEANSDLFADVTGFWHSATGASTITDQLGDSTRASIVSAVHAKGVKIIGAVTDGTPAHSMSAILANTTTRKAHVSALVALAVSNHYDGIDLDYEKFAFSDGSSTWAATRPNWVAFIKQLSAALHAKGLWLTVSVPVMYDSDRDGSSGYWVYDYAGIGPYVDRLRIMTYDYSVSAAGPIAPIAWVKRVLDFATTQVSASRIQVGVPSYGRDWPKSTAGCPVDNMPARDTYTSVEAQALATSKGLTATWSPTEAERTFSYSKTYSGENSIGDPASCTITRTVWFEEDSAALARAKLVGEYHLAGIAQWTIGGEDSAQWAKIRSYAKTITKVSPRVTLVAGDTVYGSTVHVTGTVKWASGLPVTGEDWALQWRPATSDTWTTTNRGTTSATGTLSVVKAPTRSGYWRLWVSGSWYRYSATTDQNRTLVRLKVDASLSKTSVKHGTPVTLRGHVSNEYPGFRVDRERYVDGAWVVVASTTTSATGDYSWTFSPGTKGAYVYRVRVSGATYRATGYSPTLHMTVT